MKLGDKGCRYFHRGESGFVDAQAVSIVDTTSTRDSFNAGYISKRLNGSSVEQSYKAGHRLASAVVQHRGAIMPKEAMPN